MIPKIIHQCCMVAPPSEVRQHIYMMKRSNPGWAYIFWSDNDMQRFVNETCSRHERLTYSMFKLGVCRADYFRYLLMKYIGGVYLDIKSFPKAPLDSFILPEDTFIVSKGFPTWRTYYELEGITDDLKEYMQWFLISERGSPIIQRTLDLIDKEIDEYTGMGGRRAVLSLTGPIVFTKAVVQLNRPVREIPAMELPLEYTVVENHHKFFGKHYSRSSASLL